ncbi:hypothetical protein BN1095_6830001 [Clostridioides difficile]|uniref:Uncharacterized protein n=1 Tax=Clostridioides difficile TaxID=1496 RepID=A0A069B1K7_CLODI|nr:hypothetical protein BN1095_6830001 [Clostridioides difficile]
MFRQTDYAGRPQYAAGDFADGGEYLAQRTAKSERTGDCGRRRQAV